MVGFGALHLEIVLTTPCSTLENLETIPAVGSSCLATVICHKIAIDIGCKFIGVSNFV